MYYLLRWLTAWACLIDAICGIVTGGHWQPWWGIRVMAYSAKRKYRPKRHETRT